MNPKYAKNARYRARLRQRGLCDKCGKPAAPYVNCEFHRFYRRLLGKLQRGAEFGFFKKDAQGRFASGDSSVRVGKRGFYNVDAGGQLPRHLAVKLRQGLADLEIERALHKP